MRIVHINIADGESGGAIAGRRLHQALRQAGHDSRMLVWRKTSDDPTIQIFGRARLARLASRSLGEGLDALGLQYFFHPASWSLPSHPWIQAADVVHLHVLHGGYFSPQVLPRLGRVCPLIWTMHDLWAATGHCAVAAYHECQRWQTGCGACPQLDDYPAIRFDTTAWLWRLKRNLYRRSRLTVTCPSAWMCQRVSESPLLRSLHPTHIPNGVDLSLFRPIPMHSARQALGIDPGCRLLMVSSPSLSAARKGGAHLLEALRGMQTTGEYRLLLVGRGSHALAAQLEQGNHLPVGLVRDERLMALYYSAADLFVFPSGAENLPYSLIESAACGTPAVCFDVGGNAEIVEQGVSGILAPPGDASGLGAAIAALLSDPERLRRMGHAAAARARQKFDIGEVAGQFAALYDRALTGRN